MFFKLSPRIIPFTVILLILAIPVAHYYVPTPGVSDTFIEQSRSVPDLSVLNELDSFFPLRTLITSKSNLLAEAQMVVDGNFLPPGYPGKTFNIPPDLDSFEKNGRSDLFLARFAIQDILVDAFAVSGNDAYLICAKDLVVAFSRMEQQLWINHGLIWNDHAIAERVMVAIKVWRSYRNHYSFNQTDAKAILKLVKRSVLFLLKDSLYKARTNHALMQNLALLQICIAFPDIENIDSIKKTAYNRLIEMFPSYLSSEGVILEHSAGYHQKGLELVGKSLRYLTLLGMSIPPNQETSYEKAKGFYANLRRPDGTLPKFGDTSGWEYKTAPLVTQGIKTGKYTKLSQQQWRPLEDASYYPDSGYAVWWGGLDNYPTLKDLNQTVIVWSYFQGNAHKHADEMSFLLWSEGQDWLTSSGYFPYGTELRRKAISWGGSNAPHLVGEPHGSDRRTVLRGYIDDENLKMIDLERLGPGSFRARRQLLFLEKEQCWLVVDSTDGEPDHKVRTTWNGAATTKNWQPGNIENSFTLIVKDKHSYLNAYIVSNNHLDIKAVKGSQSPFAGWDATWPSPALMVDQPANKSMTATIFLLNQSLALSGERQNVSITDLSDPQQWVISLPREKGSMKIQRLSSKIRVADKVYHLADKSVDSSGKDKPPVKKDSTVSMSGKLKTEMYDLVTSKRFLKICIVFLIFFLTFQEMLLWLYRNSSRNNLQLLRKGLTVFWTVVFLAIIGVNAMLVFV